MKRTIILIGIVGLIILTGCKQKYNYEEMYNQCIKDNINMFNRKEIAEQDYESIIEKSCIIRGYSSWKTCGTGCTIPQAPMCCYQNYCVGYEHAIEVGQGNEEVGSAGVPIAEND